MKINKELLKSIVRLAADGAHYNEMHKEEDELLFLYERLNNEPVQISNASGKGYVIEKKPETFGNLLAECLINDDCRTCHFRAVCRRFRARTGYDVPVQMVDLPNDLREGIE